MLELLLWLTARDGVRVPQARLVELVEQGCGAGEPIACALRAMVLEDPGALEDRDAVARALEPLCDEGQAMACLGRAFALMPLRDSGVDPLASNEPEEIRSLVTRACRAGLPRGCTELGTVHALGVGTYVGPLAAEQTWASACDAGEPRACSLLGHQLPDRSYLDEGISRGDVAGWLLVADLYPRERADALTRACEAGATGACVELAQEQLWTNLKDGVALPGSEYEGPRQGFSRACELGDPVGCAWTARIDAATGVLARAEAVRTLEGLCASVPSVCEQAHFLKTAPDAPVHLIYPGDVGVDSHFTRLVFDNRDAFDRCARQWLEREPDGEGSVEMVLQVEVSGLISSVYVEDPAQPTPAAAEHAKCAAAVVAGKALHEPAGGPARMVVELPVYHGAQVDFAPLFPSPGDPEVARLSADEPAWALPADQCLQSTVGPLPDVQMLLGFQALRDGGVRSVTVLESSEEPPLDQCMVDWLSNHRFIDPVHVGTAASARVDFLRTLLEPPLTDPKPKPPPAPTEVAPTPVRVLVLSLSRSLLELRPARMSRKTRESIRLAHEQLEDEVARLTHGSVVLQTTVRDLQLSTSALTYTDGSWLLAPEGLERPILEQIEAGQWDAVFVWVPTTAHEQPLLGTMLDATTARGATLSVLPVPGAGELRIRQGLPAWELPLRMLWRQASLRADRLLGVSLPSDEEALLVDHHVLDPRLGGAPPSHTVLGWYAEVLGYRVHPELWRDLWRSGRFVKSNLAQGARPTVEGVLVPEGLNDTVIELGRFANVPVGDPEAETISFGLQWRSPVRIQEVVAHVGDRSAPDRPSLKNPALEVLGPDLQSWVAVQAQVSAEGSEIRFVMAPTDVYGVRLKVTDGAVSPACRELEVH